jgi:signal transduction histidine kinase
MLRLDDVLDAKELRFSRQLGKAARWVQGLLLLATAVLALALIASGLSYAGRMWLRVARSQRAVEEGNTRWTLAAEAGRLGLMEWRVRDDTVLLDARAIAIYELPPAPGNVYSARELRLLVHPDDRQAMKQEGLRAMAARSSVVQRFRVVLPSGRLRHLAVDGRAFLVDGRSVSHMVGLLRDVTDEVTAHHAQLEEGAAQRTYLARREFLSRVSHELRTPLNAVIGFSELLEQQIFGTLNDKQRTYVSNVLVSGRHLLQLVNDILDISKVEAGRMDLVYERTPIGSIVDVVRGVIGAVATKRGINLEVALPPGLPDVYIDPGRIKQVLYNLISNAIKFTPRGGAVRLAARADARSLVVSVSDTGIGIARADLPRLFREFEQLAQPNGTRPEGTGLGLALSRRLVELHGGRVEVESELGRGSTFSVHLPLKSPDETTGIRVPGLTM